LRFAVTCYTFPLVYLPRSRPHTPQHGLIRLYTTHTVYGPRTVCAPTHTRLRLLVTCSYTPHGCCHRTPSPRYRVHDLRWFFHILHTYCAGFNARFPCGCSSTTLRTLRLHRLVTFCCCCYGWVVFTHYCVPHCNLRFSLRLRLLLRCRYVVHRYTPQFAPPTPLPHILHYGLLFAAWFCCVHCRLLRGLFTLLHTGSGFVTLRGLRGLRSGCCDYTPFTRHAAVVFARFFPFMRLRSVLPFYAFTTTPHCHRLPRAFTGCGSLCNATFSRTKPVLIKRSITLIMAGKHLPAIWSCSTQRMPG